MLTWKLVSRPNQEGLYPLFLMDYDKQKKPIKGHPNALEYFFKSPHGWHIARENITYQNKEEYINELQRRCADELFILALELTGKTDLICYYSQPHSALWRYERLCPTTKREILLDLSS